MEKFKVLASRKIAGVPVYVILLLVASAVLYTAIRAKPSKATSDAPAADATADGDAAVNTDQPVFMATPVISQPSGGSANAVGVASTTAPDTDDAWQRRAVEWLIANKYSNATATTAISKYLAGEPLTTTEAAARDAVVKQFGLPPESIPATSTIPKPPTSSPTSPSYSGPASRQGTPPTVHTVKGTSDDTFAELRQLYYGGAGYGTGTIAAHNIQYPEGHRIPVGSRVIIPKLVAPVYYKATGATRTLPAIAAKNGTTSGAVAALNPGVKFPVAVGRTVRIR